MGNMTIKTEVYFVLQRFFWFPLCFVFMKTFMNNMLFCIFFKYLLEGMSRINKHLRSLCSKNKTFVKYMYKKKKKKKKKKIFLGAEHSCVSNYCASISYTHVFSGSSRTKYDLG